MHIFCMLKSSNIFRSNLCKKISQFFSLFFKSYITQYTWALIIIILCLYCMEFSYIIKMFIFMCLFSSQFDKIKIFNKLLHIISKNKFNEYGAFWFTSINIFFNIVNSFLISTYFWGNFYYSCLWFSKICFK